MQAAPTTLKSRLLRAGSWSFLGHVLSQVIRFGSNVLLAQFLMPDAFGLTGTVLVLTVGFALFSDLGIVQNVVRHPNGEDPNFLNTAWTVQIIRGVVIWLVSVGVAVFLMVAAGQGWVQQTYADPRMPWIIIATSFCAIFQGFESTKLLVERRHMRLKRLTQIELSGQVIATIVMALLAWWTRSIWALVIGAMVASFMRSLLTHVAITGMGNRLCWDRKVLKDLLSFGKWVFLSSILFFLASNSDRLILAALVEPTLMGLYAIAFTIISAPIMVVATLAGNLALPALSEVVRDRPQDLRSVALKFQRLSDYFLVPVVGIVGVAGPSVVNLFYNANFQEAGPILSILAIGALAHRYQVLEQCYLAMDKPKIFTMVNVARFVCSYVGIPLAFKYGGFQGALIAIVAIQYAGWPAAFYFKAKHDLLDWKSELMVVPLLLVGIALGWPLSWLLDGLAPLLQDAVQMLRTFVKGGEA
ncbi:MAG: oligosaccharide flippase family protein [Pseudomonadota bacterium]